MFINRNSSEMMCFIFLYNSELLTLDWRSNNNDSISDINGSIYNFKQKFQNCSLWKNFFYGTLFFMEHKIAHVLFGNVGIISQ